MTDAQLEDAPKLSPSALNRFLGCEYRTYLDLLDGRGELDAERRPPRLQLLLDRGQRHEDEILDGLLAEGHDVVSIKDDDASVNDWVPTCTGRGASTSGALTDRLTVALPAGG